MDSNFDLVIKAQKEDGSFSGVNNLSSLLTSSLILSELKDIPHSDLDGVKLKLNGWILSQKNDDWIFDTSLLINFIAVSALSKNNPEFVTGASLGKILNLLTTSEVQEGGPYYCSGEKNIDLGANSAIAYFLHSCGVDLPNLNNLMEAAIRNKVFSSSLSPNPYLNAYLISKSYAGPLKDDLVNYLNSSLKTISDDLDRLLVLRSLRELGEPKDEPQIKASSALEAVLYLNLNAYPKDNPTEQSDSDQLILEEILKEAELRFENLSADLKTTALAQIQRTMKNNRDKQMSLMAYYFKQALGSKGHIFDNSFVAKAGLANIFFWTAFIIYDDFWDEDEMAIPSILPTANLYARHYIDFYNNILTEIPEFRSFFHDLMDKLDAANTWETLYCRAKVNGSKFIMPERIPEYGNYELKFQPASGQVLGPLAMMLKAGYKLNSIEVSSLIEYFKNYLIAMQINDDAHDLIEDMQRGHLSTVVVMLLEEWRKKYPERLEIDLVDDLEEIQQLFWFKVIPVSCQIAIDHTQKSRRALTSLSFLEKPAPLAHFIDLSENIARQALTEHEKSLELLEEFK